MKYSGGNVLLQKLASIHSESGLSMRAVANRCSVDYTHVSKLLSGKRNFTRNMLIKLCGWGWRISRLETEVILIIANYPPLGPMPTGVDPSSN